MEKETGRWPKAGRGRKKMGTWKWDMRRRKRGWKKKGDRERDKGEWKADTCMISLRCHNEPQYCIATVDVAISLEWNQFSILSLALWFFQFEFLVVKLPCLHLKNLWFITFNLTGGKFVLFFFQIESFKLLIRQLRARRALMQVKDVPLRTRRGLLLYKVYGDSSFLVLNGTPLISINTLLALSRRINHNHRL